MKIFQNIAGDKSLSHRILFFSLLKKRKTAIKNLNLGYDLLSTVSVLKRLGVSFSFSNKEMLCDSSNAFEKENYSILDCENSGTTFRLLTGVLAGKSDNYSYILSGDSSLKKRNMCELISSLKQMGGKFFCLSK